MKRGLFLILVAVMVLYAHAGFAQTTVRLGDLPKSDYTIHIFQVYGFQENAEGYKITYINTTNQPSHLYLPAQLLEKVRIYTPQANTYNANFLIIWKKGEKVERVEWYKPQAIDYKLPNYSLSPYSEKDKPVFKSVVSGGELILGEVAVTAPVIRAPGGEE